MLRPSVALAVLLAAAPALPIEPHYPQATLRGFPDLSDEHGTKIADGALTQWVEKGKLHLRMTWEFAGGKRVEERAVLVQAPELAQESWSFEEREGGDVTRRFDIDFLEGRAAGSKLDDKGKPQGWSKKIDIKPGKTFAGLGFNLAASALYDRLKEGEKIELEGVIFMPQPHVGSVELSIVGQRTLKRGGKSLTADVVKIHPKVPWPINKIVGARDIELWYFHGSPPQLLRALMPLAELKDPMVRIDVLPGGTKLSKPAARRADD